jgi:uncharacterized protein (TIGR00255 family)
MGQNNILYSMTGFASKTFTVPAAGEGPDLNFKLEMKSLNHRFLDLKLRIPREWSTLEQPIRTLVESKVKRGTVEFWVERVNESSRRDSNATQINFAQAEEAYKALSDLQRRFNLSDTISVRDVISFPEVLGKSSSFSVTEETLDALKTNLLKAAEGAVQDLLIMRAQEGEKLRKALLAIVTEFQSAHLRLSEMRTVIQNRAKEKVRKRIEQAFEAYPTADQQVRALLETRVAQEVVYALEKLDVEEELTRLKGHLDQIETIFKQGGQVGKKLDFMFQELNREINTLGNKSQDLEISQEVISLKMWIEQMREQSLNLE